MLSTLYIPNSPRKFYQLYDIFNFDSAIFNHLDTLNETVLFNIKNDTVKIENRTAEMCVNFALSEIEKNTQEYPDFFKKVVELWKLDTIYEL